MRIRSDRFVDKNSPITYMSLQDIRIIDSNSLTIPLMVSEEYEILLKVNKDSKRMSEFSKCYTGEIDLSLNKKYVHLEDTYCRMLRGAQVQKFYTTDNISQGDILYLDDALYLKENDTPRSKHHLQPRIVMQDITGVNETYRLKMTLDDSGVYCANSVNYLIVGEDNYYFLGLLNSNLLNWVFAKLSTNSNVNGYEIDNIPINTAEQSEKQNITITVKEQLNKPNNSILQTEFDEMVYSLYDINEEEKTIIEQRY